MDINKFDITVESIFGGGVNEKRLSKAIHYISFFKHTILGNCSIMRLFSPKQLHRFFVRDKYDVEIAYLENAPTRIISGCEDKNVKLHAWIHCTLNSTKAISASYKSINEVNKCYSRFDKIHCVSKSVLESFLRYYPIFSNVDVLYNTIETDKILNMMNETVEDVVFNKNEINICAIGKLVKLKGFDRLVRIHKKLIEDGYPIHTYILGTGEEKGNLERFALENNINNTFTLLRYKTNPYKYMSYCDIFVCSSLSEGFSTATMEALIVGDAVVSVDVSGAKEMLGDNNEYGVVTDNNEEALYIGLKSLISNPELIEHYKKQAMLRCNQFSADKTVKTVENSILENINE